IWIRRKRLPCDRADNAIDRQARPLLEIFDGLFCYRIEVAGDIRRREHLGHYKDALKSSYVPTSRTDADCWATIHGSTLSVFARFSRRNFSVAASLCEARASPAGRRLQITNRTPPTTVGDR